MNENPSIAAVTREIEIRTQELEALKNALTVLQSDRQSHVHIVAGRDGQFAISNIFTPPNGHGAVEITAVQEPAAAPEENPRERTARLLKLFDRRTSRSLEDVAAEAKLATRNIAVGILMKHGYLKAKGKGYVRTAKTYTA